MDWFNCPAINKDTNEPCILWNFHIGDHMAQSEHDAWKLENVQ